MPIYEYKCYGCEKRTEQHVPVGTNTVVCPACGHVADRVYSAPAIHFKGSGFHNTDYKRKKEHGAKEDKPPQEVKKDADKTSSADKPSGGDSKPARKTDS